MKYQSIQHTLEAVGFDRQIVVLINPVRTMNIQIAEIGPSSEPAVRVDTMRPVEFAYA